MRILALRGENLASLADPFEIDLGAEPLAGAGLFAITGETGAGKSTLLDAVCLALYGRFPRIAEGSDQDLPDVGDEVIRARDARSILRRGAASGRAEVDFVGVDGAAYRVLWRVYRAHGRPGGRLQPAVRHLHRLDAAGAPVETVADKATAVDLAVERLTDFTFDQFSRTVMLPQGDFDAFLAAREGERADLLEKITGTAVYARLSAGVFDRAKIAREEVTRLLDRHAAIGLLEPDARADRDRRLAEVAARLAEIATATESRRTDLARLDAVARAGDELAAAEADVVAAEAAAAAAAPHRDRHAAILAAAPLRPFLEDVDKARAATAASEAALAETDRALAEATPRLEAAVEGRGLANARLAAFDVAVEALKPQWEAAARLDVLIEEDRRDCADALGPEADAALAVAGFAAEATAIAGRRAAVAARFGRLREEQARHAAIVPLAARWDEIATRLDERAHVRAALTGTAAARVDAETRVAAATARLAEENRETAERTARRAAAEARRSDRLAVLASLDEAAAAARLDLCRHLETLAADRARLAADDAERDAAIAAADATLAETAARIERLGAAAARAAAERDAIAGEIAARAGALRLAEAVETREAAHLRARLVDGAPCPVCGALDHPVLADPTIFAAVAAVRDEHARLDARSDALAADLARTRADLAAAEATRAAAARTRTDALARREADTPARLALDREWRDRAAALGTDPADLDPAAVAAERDRAAAVIDAVRTLRRDVDAAVADLARLAEDDAGAAERGRALAADLVETRLAAARLAEAETSERRRLADLDGRLAPLLATVDIGPDDLDRDGPAIGRRLAEAVAAHLRRRDEETALAAEENELEREEHAVDAQLVQAKIELARRSTTLADHRAVLAGHETQRAGLLDGRPTGEHRAAVETERRAVIDALAAAEDARDAAVRLHDAALTRRSERRHALDRARTALHEAIAERDRAVEIAGRDLDEAAALLAVPAEEIAALGEALAALDARLAAARLTRDARRAALDAAQAAAPTDLARDGLVAAVAALDAEATALQREYGALAQVLAADDEARTRASGVEAEIAGAREAAEVWGAVDAAIGSRDGDKFRRFAQGITLDRLAALANRHLATLAPRYRLLRTEGLGLAIVDRDMGEEVRSTRSLSGGERFLTSLALALSLSGLEGGRSFVDTLFVDEGFGTLDAATLDVAIDALESLQSEGRKVGVISHVAAMHDRIPVQIRVDRAGAGLSRVRVVDRAFD